MKIHRGNKKNLKIQISLTESLKRKKERQKDKGVREIHGLRERERQTSRQTDRQAGRQILIF